MEENKIVYPTRVQKGYRIAIPRNIRTRLGVKEGDDLDVILVKKEVKKEAGK